MTAMLAYGTVRSTSQSTHSSLRGTLTITFFPSSFAWQIIQSSLLCYGFLEIAILMHCLKRRSELHHCRANNRTSQYTPWAIKTCHWYITIILASVDQYTFTVASSSELRRKMALNVTPRLASVAALHFCNKKLCYHREAARCLVSVVVSFNSTIPRAQSFIISYAYMSFRFTNDKFRSVVFSSATLRLLS